MLLAVDTSTTQIGIALYDDAQVIGEFAWRSGQRHTVELAPAISDLLIRCGLTMDAVRALGVALGPGSFTSLRVGLALAKGVALAKDIPLIGIPTLDILAHAQPASELPLAVAIQAGRSRFALGWYKSLEKAWQAQGEVRIVTVAEINAEVEHPSILCAEFSAQTRQEIKNENIQLVSPAKSIRRPAILAELAWARWQASDVDDAASLTPIYLHTDGSLSL
jgi:tRNA threonylcarbamoyladenosine biosynthesis protein TsaB